MSPLRGKGVGEFFKYVWISKVRINELLLFIEATSDQCFLIIYTSQTLDLLCFSSARGFRLSNISSTEQRFIRILSGVSILC